MRCHSCGAQHEIDFEQCEYCGALAIDELAETVDESIPTPPRQPSQTSRLIEFPGVFRSTVPQWRQELSERVREVQERRALEAAAEEQRRRREATDEPKVQLELLPQAEVAPVNPLVAAALRRIERAHVQPSAGGGRGSSVATAIAVAYAEETEYVSDEPTVEIAEVSTHDVSLAEPILETQPPPVEKAHNLVVVPPPQKEAKLEITTLPIRTIAGDPNDPALNYLDSIPTAMRVEDVRHVRAPAFSRFVAASIDLFVVMLLWSPFAAAVELASLNWQNLRVVITGGVIYLIVGFLYLTASIALTGRTLGMRLLSLRVVDERTGLIPTGSQSAGRGLIYLASLLTLGIGPLCALLDSERRTIHDRLTRTVVVLT